MANSWQQPVAGEPSLGTLHPCAATVVVSTDPADANWSAAVDISAVVPVGTKAVYCQLELRSANTTAYYGQVAGDTTPSSPYLKGLCGSVASVSNQYVYGWVYLTSGLNLYWQAQSANISVLKVTIMAYSL